MDQKIENTPKENSDVVFPITNFVKTCAVVLSGVVMLVLLIMKVNASDSESGFLPFYKLDDNAKQNAAQVQGVQTGPIGPGRPFVSPTIVASSTPTLTATQAIDTPTPSPTPQPVSNNPPVNTNTPTPTVTPTESPTPTITPTIEISPTPTL